MAYSLFITNISCHLAAPPLSHGTPCSSAISLLPFPHLLCLHIGRACRPLEGLLHSWLPLLCLDSPLPFAQTYRSLPPLLLCHLFCPGLKIHFHNQSASPTTSNPLSFILWPLSFGVNPFHISIKNVCFIKIHLVTSRLCDLKILSLLYWSQRIACAFGGVFRICENPQIYRLQINVDCCVIRFLWLIKTWLSLDVYRARHFRGVNKRKLLLKEALGVWLKTYNSNYDLIQTKINKEQRPSRPFV